MVDALSRSRVVDQVVVDRVKGCRPGRGPLRSRSMLVDVEAVTNPNGSRSKYVDLVVVEVENDGIRVLR